MLNNLEQLDTREEGRQIRALLSVFFKTLTRLEILHVVGNCWAMFSSRLWLSALQELLLSGHGFKPSSLDNLRLYCSKIMILEVDMITQKHGNVCPQAQGFLHLPLRITS